MTGDFPAADPLDFRLDVEPNDDDTFVDPRDAAPDPPKEKTLAELQEEVRLANAERDIALKAMNRPIEAPAPAAAPAGPPQPDPRAREAFDTFLEGIAQKQLMGDSKGATQDLLGLVDQVVDQKIKQATIPAASAGARQAVRNFTSSMRDDTLFPQVKDEFDTMVNQALPGISQMAPEAQDGAIEAIYNIAIGQSARKRASNGRREEPPPYATGSRSTGARASSQAKALTAVQRQYVLSAREAGIPEDRIRQRLVEMDRDAG